MKRVLLSTLILIFIAVSAYAADVVAKHETATATVTTVSSYFYGVLVTPDGTNDVTITVYNGTSTSGDKITPAMTFAGDGGTQYLPLQNPIACPHGVHVVATTTGTVEYVVYYRQR